jgi:alkaline phosphatase D
MRRFWCLVAVGAVLVSIPVAVSATSTETFPQSVASGDPTPTSVVLWTRVGETDAPGAIIVEVATDAEFTDVVYTRSLEVDSDYDGVIKVRADGLQPYHDYYYRFIYGSGAMMQISPVGRTRTAPDPAAAQPLRFAVVYCQDYIGRYYNSYLKLLEDYGDDIDFVVHLGDYVYETTGDPSFQDPDSERSIVFSDVEGAIELGSGDSTYYAAASLSNYRDLYRTYRNDPVLQQIHERWPMIVIWDDHEFSNDSWQDNATYTNGREDEQDHERKWAAEQAFYEWVPSEHGLNTDGVLDIGADNLYPNSGVYRDYRFGSLLHLMLTDYRTFRPDHLIPEDAFPGTIAVDQTTVQALLAQLGIPFETVAPSLDPYINMSLWGAFLPVFQHTANLIAAQAYSAENPALDQTAAVRAAEAALQGNISVTYLEAMYAAAGLPSPFSPELKAMLPRGVSFLFMGKQSIYSSTGSRVMVLHDPFQLYAAARAVATGGASEDVFGPQQLAWMQVAIGTSDTAWRVVGNSVMMTPLVVDFTNPLIEPQLPEGFPDVLRTRLGINIEDFNGFPEMRRQLIKMLQVRPNTVVISGDIHAAFVTDHGQGVYEFTGPAISSATLGDAATRLVLNDPILGQVPGIEDFIQFLPLFLQISSLDDVSVSPSDIAFANTSTHGFMVVDVDPDKLDAKMYLIPSTETATSYYDNPEDLDGVFQEVGFTVEDGTLMPHPAP